MMLVHFSGRSISSPSHIANAHQKWLHTDFIHLLSFLHDFFCAALRILDLMCFQRCHTSNWCSISLRSSQRYLCRSVVICFSAMPFCAILSNTLIKPYFSIRLELPASVTWVRDISIIFDMLLSYSEYVQYFALYPGLSHLPPPLK